MSPKIISEATPELYQWPLYPDVLFVSASENVSGSNSDHIYDSVTALQINGPIPKTTVYDKIALRVTYTMPLVTLPQS